MRQLFASLVLLVAACSPLCPGQVAGQCRKADEPRPDAEEASLPLLVSVRDLMGGEIAFSAHIVEDIRSPRRPLMQHEWGAVRTAAANLSASATLLTMPNPSIVDALRRQDARWLSLARSMQAAATGMAAAAFLQDEDALDASAMELRQSCTSCHARFGVHGE